MQPVEGFSHNYYSQKPILTPTNTPDTYSDNYPVVPIVGIKDPCCPSCCDGIVGNCIDDYRTLEQKCCYLECKSSCCKKVECTWTKFCGWTAVVISQVVPFGAAAIYIAEGKNGIGIIIGVATMAADVIVGMCCIE